jgi:hypothetical protein
METLSFRAGGHVMSGLAVGFNPPSRSAPKRVETRG